MANIVAIVGRPNVGKSTLFNRLISQRQAITEDVSGITRDRHYGTAEWGGYDFTVIDTGGYVPNSKDPFERAIRAQVKTAMEEASVILFVVDCTTGVTPLDEEFASLLRTSTKPVLLVANKADNLNRSFLAHEFYKLGIGEQPYAVSAISGSGTGELLDAVTPYLAALSDEEDATYLPKVAIVGRPNVGKSSFLNVVLGQERTIVTPIAGTTRDSIHTHYNLFGKNFILTDTAGIRKKTKVKDNIEFYSVVRSIKAIQHADVCITILDATQGLEAQDVNIMGLAHRYKKGQVVLVNKWDLITKDNHSTEHYKKQLYEKFPLLRHIPILFTSTIKKQRIYQAIEKALEVYENRKKRIATPMLNKVLLPLIEAYPPPTTKGKYIRIKYVTQLPTPTPTFAFFCNLPQYIKPPYKGYLENQLRQHFNFEGAPVTLIFREK